ncbi:two-component system sensor histidine kinase TctE [Aliiruegeria haliotis]|uniref:histidine kinase n=1 Tax=Aliiruegeria haliotis TaxID=1280846 RepID=A0A2T0S071_9RHOB|nr:sensor histidine kinase [Aliiruegeria haliotis]PRY26693.1 two-component system sensor histidine kinase TctE [Aliiruegeria haliotis]
MTADVQPSGSIRRRLTLQLLFSAALLAGLLFAVVQNFAREVAEESQDSVLLASVTSILDAVTVQEGEIVADIPYSALSMLGNVSDDRVFYRILANGEMLTGYADLPDMGLSEGEIGSVAATGTYAGESVRMVSASRRIALEGGPVEVVVSVAQTRSGHMRRIRQISRDSLVLGIGFFAIAALFAVLAAQSTVRPLNVLTGSVSRRGPQDLRPVTGSVPSEMVPLVRSLNRFIARLKITLSRSEDFIAEAAHRVRTPLATVRAQAEVALQRVEKPENRQSLKDMIRAIDESSRAAGQLLDHAMITFRSDQLEHREIDLRELVMETVERLRPVAGLKDIVVTVTSPDRLSIPGDAILVQSAIGNVIDNAIKYSPAESDIEVELEAGSERAVVRVLDEGPGFGDEDLHNATRRFARGRNSEGTVGSGLGLTIAEDVARAHGGGLGLRNRTGEKGACVSLVLASR